MSRTSRMLKKTLQIQSRKLRRAGVQMLNSWWLPEKPYKGRLKPHPVVAAQIMKLREGTVNRTSVFDCPACQETRQHTAYERRRWHPRAGEGYSKP